MSIIVKMYFGNYLSPSEDSYNFSFFLKILGQLDDLVTEIPRVKSHMAGILGYLVGSGTLLLADMAEPLEGGKHFPLFLLTLQTLHKLHGKSKLTQIFNESKVSFFHDSTSLVYHLAELH